MSGPTTVKVLLGILEIFGPIKGTNLNLLSAYFIYPIKSTYSVAPVLPVYLPRTYVINSSTPSPSISPIIPGYSLNNPPNPSGLLASLDTNSVFSGSPYSFNTSVKSISTSDV